MLQVESGGEVIGGEDEIGGADEDLMRDEHHHAQRRDPSAQGTSHELRKKEFKRWDMGKMGSDIWERWVE